MKKKNKPMKNSQRLCRIYELVKEWDELTEDFCKLKEEVAEMCEKEEYLSNGYNYYFKRFDEIGEELYSLGYDLGKLK